jgi:deoxyribodipyrimidine photo-lyase
MKSLFIFRRDFRLNDNTALIECYKKSEQVIPIFIFTPEQVSNNEYFSSNAFQFMLESLEDLDNELKNKYNSQIHYYYGDNIKILDEILKNFDFDAIFFNKDYTIYAQNRDKSIEIFCNENDKSCNMYEDYLLSNIGTYLKNDGKPYEKYTPFKNNAKNYKVKLPINYKFKENKFSKIKFIFDIKSLEKYFIKNDKLLIKGGRENALKRIKYIKEFINYGNERNDLIRPTTHLSAYIKFGCVSIREVYDVILKNFGINHGLIDQLYWREFYFYLAYYIPRVLEGKSLKPAYDKIKWENNEKIFKAWTEGKTGFPAVDAGIREMNETGYMHNRARLITSGILIKILNCDWRMGEKYFANMLVDYDPIVNNGNWQWSSGSGADSQPYFRIMSPWKQAIDNDPNCEYIKKWIPELKDVPIKDILNWGKNYKKYEKIYNKPIVDYEKMRKEIVNVYKKGLY